MIAFPPGMRVWLAGDDARFLGQPRDGLAGLALDHRHEAVGERGRAGSAWRTRTASSFFMGQTP
jgi:hypothetical protein